MRVAVLGQGAFGRAALTALVSEGHDVAFVGAPGGWAAHSARRDPLAEKGHEKGLPTYEGDGRNLAGLLEVANRDEKIDLIVAAHSHWFVSRKSRDLARYGAIGYHPSLLPRHRGRDAIRWTIHMRDPIAGGTVYWLSDNIDAGDILLQDWCHVHPDWDARGLWRNELFPMGVKLLVEGVWMVDRDGIATRRIPQNEELATWEPSWERPPMMRPDLRALPERA